MKKTVVLFHAPTPIIFLRSKSVQDSLKLRRITCAFFSRSYLPKSSGPMTPESTSSQCLPTSPFYTDRWTHVYVQSNSSLSSICPFYRTNSFDELKQWKHFTQKWVIKGIPMIVNDTLWCLNTMG